MTEIGSMSIVGSFDSTEIESGLLRVEGQLKLVQSQSESTDATFMRLNTSVKGIANSMVTIGTVGVTAMTSLATLSPAVAPSLAQIGIQMRQLSFALGEELSPVFDAIANELLPAIGSAVDTLSPQISALVNVGVEGISDISSALTGDISSIENLIPKTGMAALGAAAGFALLGPKGLFIGAALGYAAESAVVPDVSAADTAQYGVFAETAVSAEETASYFTSGPFVDPTQVPTIRDELGLLSSGFKTGANAIFDVFEWIIGKFTEKDMTYASSNKGNR